jgi:hypothetical protein
MSPSVLFTYRFWGFCFREKDNCGSNSICNHALSESLGEGPNANPVRRICRRMILKELVALTGIETVSTHLTQSELVANS